MTTYLIGLRCRECGARCPAEARSACNECFGPLEPEYDYDAIRARTPLESITTGPLTLWRYAPLLPADVAGAVDLSDGFTPLRHAERLGAELGLPKLHLKDETKNPTHSFKDRVVSVPTLWPPTPRRRD